MQKVGDDHARRGGSTRPVPRAALVDRPNTRAGPWPARASARMRRAARRVVRRRRLPGGAGDDRGCWRWCCCPCSVARSIQGPGHRRLRRLHDGRVRLPRARAHAQARRAHPRHAGADVAARAGASLARGLGARRGQRCSPAQSPGYSARLAWQSHVFHDISTGVDATPLWIPQLPMADRHRDAGDRARRRAGARTARPARGAGQRRSQSQRMAPPADERPPRHRGADRGAVPDPRPAASGSGSRSRAWPGSACSCSARARQATRWR